MGSYSFDVSSLGALLTLTPRQFEQVVAELLSTMGYREIQLTGGAGDLAADILCKDQSDSLVAVQCKRYAPGSLIGTPAIQTFIGMMVAEHQASSGMFVTTSEFKQEALKLAVKHNVTTVGGSKLVQMFNDTNATVGIETGNALASASLAEAAGSITVYPDHVTLIVSGERRTIAIDSIIDAEPKRNMIGMFRHFQIVTANAVYRNSLAHIVDYPKIKRAIERAMRDMKQKKLQEARVKEREMRDFQKTLQQAMKKAKKRGF
jgi:hypothetical protein